MLAVLKTLYFSQIGIASKENIFRILVYFVKLLLVKRNLEHSNFLYNKTIFPANTISSNDSQMFHSLDKNL